MALELLIGFILLFLAFFLKLYFKDHLHPASVFSATWGLVIFIIALSQNLGYHQIAPLPLLLYFCGVMLFVIGAIVATRFVLRPESIKCRAKVGEVNFSRLALFCVFVHLVMLPLWWSEVVAMAGGQTDLISLSFTLRYLTATEGERLSFLVGNYLVLGFVLVPILAIGVMESKIRWVTFGFVFTPWLATNIITNGRGALVQLMLVILYLYVLNNRKLGLKSLAIVCASTAFVLILGAILVGKNDATIEEGFGGVVAPVLENALDYALQGPILFSSYFENESLILPTWDALVFPCRLLEYFDACSVGPLHQDYLPFNSNGRVGNVYSIYLSIYPKYGVAGVMLFLMLYGAWASFHHVRAWSTKSLTHSLLASYLFSAVVLSVFSDLFAPSLNFLIKLIIVSIIVQRTFVSKRI